MLRDNLVRLIVPMRSCGTQALGDEFSYLENPRPVGAESSLTGRCSSPFQTEPRQLGRSRPAADAAREVTERWLLDGLDVSVGHRRCSCDPSSQKDAGRTPGSKNHCACAWLG